MIKYELARGLLRDLLAKILRGHCQREIDAGADPGRGPDVAVAHEDLVGLEFHLRIRSDEMPGALPVRGGAAAVEQAGFGKDINPGAAAGDADAAPRHGAHEAKRLLAFCRLTHPLASCHDQGGAGAWWTQTPRQHL